MALSLTMNSVSPEQDWTSTGVRPTSHSSDVKRGRKAAKNKRERERKKLRKLEADSSIGQHHDVTDAIRAEGQLFQQEHHEEDTPLSTRAALVLPSAAFPPLQPQKDKAPALARHTKREEGGAADETEPVDSARQAATVGREELRKLLFAKVEEELARRQAVAEKAAAAKAAAAKAAAAKAATAVTEAAAEAAATPAPEMAAATAVPAVAVPATAVVADESSLALLLELYVPSPSMLPLEYSYRPILDRTALFAVHCGFCPAVAPLLLPHIVSTVYGAQFAGSVATLTAADVDYMFHVFWNYVVTTYTREEIFFRMVTRPGNSGIMRDDLRPLIAASVQYHQDFIVLSPLNKVLFVENVLTDIFFRNGRCGLIGLQDLCRSDLVASLSAVGRHEIFFSDSAYLSWHIDGDTMIPGESSPVFNGAFTSGHWDYPPTASIYAF